MTLRESQSKFALLIGKLIQWAYEQGFEITFGDAWAKTGHKNGSFHYKRLAIDLNLFSGGHWLDLSEDHRPLGEYWKSLDPMCTWGGDFSIPDGNHYSYGESNE
jgi:hypothetical protein